ncbi:uncharacterized protein LOC120684489 [Panicum virgatum]|uniref:uncharacterized protein LOC120684489 n=1 Tax=Panicum virgatum TaxID=38727 RepID=UPI0019D68C96|nr:uncharacterized protein LOC120684489 [Panicum virgatum]
MSGALKKVTGSSSSRSSSHRSSIPTSSYSHQDEQDESQSPEGQPAQQEEEQAPNDSNLDIRGERELQAYNILKDRTFGHTWEFDADLLEKTGYAPAAGTAGPSAGQQSSWDRYIPQPEAGGSSWQSGGSSEWDQPGRTNWAHASGSSLSGASPLFAARRSFSARGYRELSQGIHDINIRVGDIGDRTHQTHGALTQHIQDTERYHAQQQANQEATMELLQKQYQDAQALYRHYGYYPPPGQ